MRASYGAHAEAAIRLPEDSLYRPVERGIRARAQAGQQGATPAETFAGPVVEALLLDAPPRVIRGGTNSVRLPLLKRWLPASVFDAKLTKLIGSTRSAERWSALTEDRDGDMTSGGATWRRWLRAVPGPLAFFLLFLIGGAALLRMDPFGLTRLTKMYSQDLLAAARAGCYPGAPDGPCAREGRAAIAVVLLRDPDLRAFEGPWPPSYGFHARVLKAIRANRPKAVMVDIVFEDLRDDPSIEALAASDGARLRFRSGAPWCGQESRVWRANTG